MHFLESNLLILLGLYVFNDRLRKWFLVLFQLLMAPVVIEFLPKESVLYDGLNILSKADETVWLLWISEQKVNEFLKIGERRLLNDLFIKSMFSISILSSSLRIWLDLNNGFEWESLDWRFIIFKAFFFVG